MGAHTYTHTQADTHIPYSVSLGLVGRWSLVRGRKLAEELDTPESADGNVALPPLCKKSDQSHIRNEQPLTSQRLHYLSNKHKVYTTLLTNTESTLPFSQILSHVYSVN